MAKTHEQFVEELTALNSEIDVIGKYTKSTDTIQVRCKKCGKVWNPKAYSLLQGRSCPHCSAIKGSINNRGKTRRKSSAEFINQLHQVHPEVDTSDKYINTHTDMTFICRRCGNVWSAKPYSVLQGHGCPRCVKSGTSFMEQYIRLCFSHRLGNKAVLSRDREIIGMELDIVIPSINIAIEPGNWFLHRESLDRDKQKREKCAEKDIRLITIYDRFPDSETKPFDTDCFTFSDDLNKSDHSLLRKLVADLFENCQLTYSFSSQELEQIEQEAYQLSKSKTHDTFVNELASINPSIKVIGQYTNTNRKITVSCKVCGHIWDAIPASLLSGDGCRKCGIKKAHQVFIKDQEDFEKQLKNVNPDVKIIGQYTGRHNPVKTKCLICGHVWEPIASSLLRGSSHKGSKTMHKAMKEKEKF